MVVDTVIKNGQVVSPMGIVRTGIAINKGKIVAIAPEAYLPKANRIIDAKGNYVIPGVIDPHVHLGAGFSFEDDCRPETRAAAMGGVTTMVSLLGIEQTAYTGSCKDKEHFAHYKSLVEQNSMIDMAFSLAPTSDVHYREMPEYAKDLGISSYKFLLGWRGETGKKIGYDCPDDAKLCEAYKIVAQIGYPAMVQIHSEHAEVAAYFERQLIAEGRDDLSAWTEARPNMCCVQCTATNILYAKNLNSRLYIVHVTTKEEVDLIQQARAEGVDVIAETCPHYLVLNIPKDAKLGNLGKVTPPLKYAEDTEKLWWGINEGIVECLGSDNVPGNKQIQIGTIWAIKGGLPLGSATMLPLMLSEGVNKGRISLEKLVEVCCYNNAKVFGMYPRKGTISIGSDADLVIVDMNKEVTLSAKLFQTLADYTPYDGMKVKGWPVTTMVRGNIVVEDGEVVGRPGMGEYVPRPPLK